jgi:hypothetical protein
MLPAIAYAPVLALLVRQQAAVPPITSQLMLVGAIVAAVRQKHAIGGWLLFFFWQVVAGCAVTIAFTDWSDLSARGWNDQMQYLVFLLATAPRVAVLVTLGVLGVMLIRTFEWRWVLVIKYTLIIYVIFGCFSVAADVAYFPTRTAADVGTLIFPTVYAFYFNVSLRVRSVFRDRVWNGRAVGVAA